MTKISLAVVSAALAIGMAVPAVAGINDPEVFIYRFPGVKDDGQSSVATVFLCTNFSGVTETIRFATRRADTSLAANLTINIAHLATVTVGTGTFPDAAPAHVSNYTLNLNLTTGAVQGTTAIAATSINIICTAMVLDAGNSKPDGVALRGIRFSPVPGSQE